jgi:CubicO group peptidase (beta-lactamase class C family)
VAAGRDHVRRNISRRRASVIAAAAAVVLLGCSTSTTPSSTNAAGNGVGASSTSAAPTGTSTGTAAPAASDVVFPGATWDTVDPTAAGFSPEGLAKMATAAEGGGSNCLLVTRHGKLVQEWYWNGKGADDAQEVFSATKSYTSTLVGIAQAEGKLSIDDSASKYIPAWKGTPAEAVTVKNLLSNDSGRHWDYETDYLKMAAAAPDKNAFAIGLEQDEPPGKVWVYNNSAIQTLSAVLDTATGSKPAAYAKEKLLGPIGMAHSEMTSDRAGNTLTFMGLHSTCRDMARYGYLALNKGNWNGTQIVPAAWIDEATGHASQPLNAAYGYLWWLNRKGKIPSIISPTSAEDQAGKPEGLMVPGAPENVFWALGLGNQMIAIFPDTGVVAVRLGPTNAPKGATKFDTESITIGTQEALVTP